MMQGRNAGPAPLGVVYNTSMTRPDAALALAGLYAFADKREARLGSVCVGGAGLDAAIFCDIVARFYVPRMGNSNQVLPVGLAAATPLPPSAPMLKAAIDRKGPLGQPQYGRAVSTFTDTSLADAVLRNGVIFNAEGVMVLSAPATWLARSLDFLGTVDLYKKRVKRLVVVNTGVPERDPASLRKVLSTWPAPVFYCGPEVGSALQFPGARLDDLYKWAPAHPVVDVYKAFKAMPYDEPLHDLAAMHYAIKPDAGFFDVSEPGTLTVAADGKTTFSVGGGTIRSLSVSAGKAEQALEALLSIASAEPVPPPAGRGRGRGAA